MSPTQRLLYKSRPPSQLDAARHPAPPTQARPLSQHLPLKRGPGQAGAADQGQPLGLLHLGGVVARPDGGSGAGPSICQGAQGPRKSVRVAPHL